MLVGLQITSRLCYKQVTEGLREKFNKLCFKELSHNISSVKKVAKCAQKKLIKANYLMLIVFSYTL